MDAQNLLTDLLRDVSRSFYLTLRALPRAVRPQIGLAYLLARAADTIADTAIVPVEQRLDALGQLRGFLGDRAGDPPDLGLFLASPPPPARDSRVEPGGPTPAEIALLGNVVAAVGLLRQFSVSDQSMIRSTLDTIISGQALDLQRFAHVPAGQIRSLATHAELDDYIYRVAGCVGEFWTRICRAHVFPRADVDEPFLLENGVRFGKGLQLTNILRDLPGDLRMGRCYIPEAELRTAALKPMDLLDPANEPRFRPIYDRYRRMALEHLAAGWAYTDRLPRGALRIRLACAWPILIGRRTIELLGAGPILGRKSPAKVSRKQLRSIMIRSILSCPWPSLWHGQWHELPDHASDTGFTPNSTTDRIRVG